jgi:O-antigen ligase
MVEPLTPTTAATAPAADPLGRVLFGLLLAVLALAPTQLTLGPLHPAEPLLALAALVWAIRWLKVRDTASLPPFAHWLVLAAGALSVFALFTPYIDGAEIDRKTTLVIGPLQSVLEKAALKGWAMETAQVVLYLLIAVTLFRAALTTAPRIRTAVIVLLAATTLAVGLAVAQRALLPSQRVADPEQRMVFHDKTPRAYVTVQTPMTVCATFGSWNDKGFHPSRTAYAGFLAVALPFALALLCTSRCRGLRLWMALLLAGAAYSVLAGLLVPALLLGLLTTGIALGPRTGRWVLLGVLLYGVALLVFGGINRAEVLYEPYRLAVNDADAARLYGGTHELKKFWGEQFAALNVFRDRPIIGVGNGQYQASIGAETYDVVSKAASQRLEPDTQNGYLVTLVNTGLIGLAALLALLGLYLGLARRARRSVPGDPWMAAALGAMVALVVMMFATSPWVRGTMLPIAALLAIIGNGATCVPDERIE